MNPIHSHQFLIQCSSRIAKSGASGPARFLVSFDGRGHMMVIELEQMKRINHFATAFFGAYIQGKSGYRELLSTSC